ncbi:hypothetical protein [Caldimonas manganoxidans]|uniref:hypothetical protein n=1 Tax=Caldimonas manganoxidans TaxID=196015 RepID=UPI0012EA1E3F|nr:hypothetical protein [Caldimonas manganoxidans]
MEYLASVAIAAGVLNTFPIVLLLSAAGVGQADAITASLVSRSLTLWLAVGIGVVAMIRAAFANKQQCSASGQGEA